MRLHLPVNIQSLKTNVQQLGQRLRVLFSLNDPSWGNGNKNDKDEGNKPQRQDGPPDLDAIWKDFTQKIQGVLGGKKPSGGGDMPPSGTPQMNGKFASFGVGAILSVIAALWLLSGFFIVQEGQVGVIQEFGKLKYTTHPGINWRLPWPIQTNEVVNVSNVRSVEIGRSNLIKATNLKDSSMLTEDENIIDVKFAVQYRLKDATSFLFNNRDTDSTVTQAAETSVREIVGKSKMDYVLYEGREKIAIDLTQSIQKILDAYKTGILVTSVTMQNVQPPEQVQAAFDDAVKAGQDRERLKNEGQAYANDVIPRAQGTAARLQQEAEGYKGRVVAQAEGDASRFKQVLAEYKKAPQVTRDRMYLDTMQQIYSNATKVVVDAKQGNQLLYLPLDKLIAQTQAAPAADEASRNVPAAKAASGATANAAPAANTTPTPPSVSDNTSTDRTRELSRSRDRDAR